MEDKSRYETLKYGFTIVTLRCSLIDTLSKFRYGRKYSGNKDRFTAFLQEYFISDTNAEEVAKKAYKDIRCGIVHSGANDYKSGLSCEMIELVSFLPNNGDISLDLLILQEEVEKYFDQYIKKLKNKKQAELRKTLYIQ